jgi:lipopolysaccharide heptosyltransferase I
MRVGGQAIPLSQYPARRIGLIKPSALGDIIHALPLLTALRRRFPESHIAWVVNRSYEPLLQGHPDLSATLPFDRAAMRGGLIRAAQTLYGFAQLLRSQKFDLIVDLQGLLRSGLMTLATRAPRRVGLSSAREGATRCYTDLIENTSLGIGHAVDRYWRVAEAFGVGDMPKTFRVPLREPERQWAREILAALPRPWLMLGVGARWITKRWLPNHFAALARRALQRFGGSVILVGSRDEDEAASKTKEQLTGPIRDLTGQTTLPQLAALLANADVMIANDTGPLHLAVALGRPVVAPYTCTSVSTTGPYGQLNRAVESHVWCHGSCIKKCPRLECMEELTPERLWPALEEVLLRWQSLSRSA